MSRCRSLWLACLLIAAALWLSHERAIAANESINLQAIIDQAKPGDAIALAPGSYEGPIIINKPLTLRAEQEGSVQLHNSSLKPAVLITADHVAIIGLSLVDEGLKDEPTILATGNQASLEGLHIRTGSMGIAIRDADDGAVSDTTIHWAVNGVRMADKGNGIDMFNADRWTLTNNSIHDVHDGIYLENSDDIIVSGNVIERSRYGVHCMYTKRTIIEGNEGNRNVTGAMVMAAKQVFVVGNSFTKQSENVNSQGILLYDAHDTEVADNTVDGNRVGVYVEESTNNHFRNNRVRYNFIGVQLIQSSGNTITGNAFMGNVADAQAQGSEDNRLMDNYWDSFQGLDTDGDGRSDLSYAINPFFQSIARKRPAFQLFFQSPGMIFLEGLYQTDRERWTEDSTPLLAPLDRQLHRDKSGDGVKTGLMGLMLLGCASLLFYKMRRRER